MQYLRCMQALEVGAWVVADFAASPGLVCFSRRGFHGLYLDGAAGCIGGAQQLLYTFGAHCCRSLLEEVLRPPSPSQCMTHADLAAPGASPAVPMHEPAIM